MRVPRPHDLLHVEGLDDHLHHDAPQWVRNALQGTGWVVALPVKSPCGHHVGVRGRTHPQRYTMVAPTSCIVDTISPEDIAGVRAWPTRGIPALEALREVRAPLNHLGLPWGPIGSVGYELVAGVAAVTSGSDLDLLVRLRHLDEQVIDDLIALQRSHFQNRSAAVDCLVETSHGTLPLAELERAQAAPWWPRETAESPC